MRRNKTHDIGLLIIRIGIGLAFFFHGLPKLMEGIEGWENLGQNMLVFGIGFAPAFWGFLSASAECIGGLLIVLGIVFRPAAFILCINMIVALTMHLKHGDSFITYSHALETFVVFFALLISGSGQFKLGGKRQRR